MRSLPSALLLSLLSFALAFGTPLKIKFWSAQKKGANFFNHVETVERMRAAKVVGINFIRLAPNKWETKSRDFLIGNADKYSGLVEEDYALLKRILDQADSIGLKVLLTTLSLPGCRWKQQNDDKDDPRLWKSPTYRAQCAAFWRDLARRLKDHPAIVGYNILNEPHGPKEPDHDKTHLNTSSDLNLFNDEIIHAIRAVDSSTPIILDCSDYSSPQAITSVKSVPDTLTLYAIHMYEPWDYTTYRVNKKRFHYPGKVWSDDGDTTDWDLATLENYLQPVDQWQSKFTIPANRIIVEEFGCDRRVAGAKGYLADLISIFDRHNWHWAFYSFREDTWDAMDYELGVNPLGAEYWDAVEHGKQPKLKRFDNPLFEVIKQEFPKNRTDQ